ncbi:uncharacterized protein LOC116348063 isoform X2 [Contarinia nasturtii]|uniref:uncharacterized protein LOC116348063 isoform X2 n=1 Tax=Contarinia nasturtii TaxID=265458 RepID=UPI0012D476A1|nr:uncharacterized protein LOC116348063 isoform X2 [Contarinia nasturtii]
MLCPTVKTCCYCINLKVAGIALGLLDIFFRSVHLYIVMLEIIQKNQSMSEIHQNEEGIILRGFTIVAHFICIPISILWLIGIFMKKPGLMLSFVITSFITLLVLAVSLSVFWFVALQYRRRTLVLFVICFCLSAICFHLWIVEFSLYQSTKNLNAVRNDRQNECELQDWHRNDDF